MRILGFKNNTNPIGLLSLNNGEKVISIKLVDLKIYTKSKYSIDQIQDCHQ